MITLPKLYKIDSKGKIREWVAQIQDFPLENRAEIIIIHGELEGKKQLKVTSITSGKNIGRANETSILEQAQLEANSKWNKQQDKGYSLSPQRPFRPMLANKFEDHYKKIKFPCYVQVKLDGVRCTIQNEDGKIVARSRKGKEWTTIQYILDKVTPFLKDYPDIILDGELFTRKLTFQEIISAVKRDDAIESTKLIDFWCYDIYDKSQPNLEYRDRYYLIPNHCVTECPTVECNSINEIISCHKINTQDGFEGSIIRNFNGKYKIDARSSDLLKLKDFQDSEYKIISKRLDKNKEVVFNCIDEKLNKTFECKPEGTHERRQKYYYEDNIGKYLTVRFFELTDIGLPRFPVGVSVRDYEDNNAK